MPSIPGIVTTNEGGRCGPVRGIPTQTVSQGLRILFVGNLSESRFEVGVVPAGLLSFGA